jgi:diguanylate cyclase (GGDEF)-like protein/PAS domain S-box-containing protein
MNSPKPHDLQNKITELEAELASLRAQSRRRIKDSQSKYQRVIDATSEGFLELDSDLRIVDVNKAAENLLEQAGDALIQQSIESLYDKDSVFVHFASRDHLSFEAELKSSAGRSVPLLFKRSILHAPGGEPGGYLVFITDLTELKQAREDLQQAEDRYRSMYKQAVQGMYQCTIEGRFLRVNPAFARTFGFESTKELMNQPGGVTSLYKDPQDRKKMLSVLLENKVLTNYEVEMQSRTGDSVWVLINARLRRSDRGGTIIEGILIDNSEKHLAEEKLHRSRERFRYLANHDSLTSLYNTRYLYKELDRLIDQSRSSRQPFSLVFLDMDNFKHIVDAHGHLNGSQALKEVARTLKEAMGDSDFGVAYGGDEFVLVLFGTGKEGALAQIKTIRNNMKQTVYLQNKGLQVSMSASFGIATFPDDAEDREALLALADEAMFRIKSRGKDSIGVSGSG